MTMKFHFAERLDSFEAGIFAILNEKKDELLRQGREVYNLSVGNAGFQTGAPCDGSFLQGL